jgi:DNA-directed RNA polymerase specialized sigma24 family protein
VPNGKVSTTDGYAPALRRWEIAELAIDCRARLVGSVAPMYPGVTRDRIEELYDKVWERATQPIGQPAAFPEETYEKLEPWLRAVLIGELRHEVADRHGHTRRVSNPLVLDMQVDHSADPAETVERRFALSDLVKTAAASLSERTRLYIVMTRVYGLSRAEFRARTGWSHSRIQLARKEWAEFVARVRGGAAALAPIAWLRRLFAGGGVDAAGAGGGALGAKTIVATCGAAAVCAGGAVGVGEVQHRLDHKNVTKAHVVRKSSHEAIRPAASGAPDLKQSAARRGAPHSRTGASVKERRDQRQADRPLVDREFAPHATDTSAGGSGSSATGGSQPQTPSRVSPVEAKRAIGREFGRP